MPRIALELASTDVFVVGQKNEVAPGKGLRLFEEKMYKAISRLKGDRLLLQSFRKRVDQNAILL